MKPAKPRRQAAARRGGGPNPLSIRRIHACCGALFAPAILVFAVSGALQTFDLHKARPESGYRPSALVQALSALHKDQVLRPPRHGDDDHDKARPSAPRQAGKGDGAPPKSMPGGQLVLKWYVVAMSVALVVSTLTGLYMALQNRRDRLLVMAFFVAGVIIPLGLLVI